MNSLNAPAARRSASAPWHRLASAGALALALCLTACLLLAGCSDASEQPASADGTTSEASETVAVGALKGPTAIGLAAMMDEGSEGEEEAPYEFTVAGSADEVVPLLSQGDLDIALIPANLAATLCQKTDGAIQVIDINTLGVLYAVSQDASISSAADLAGKTVYMTGKGTVPEYSLKAILAAANLTEEDVTIEFKSEPAEVAALIEADPAAVGILPQPYATAALAQNPSFHQVLDLTQEWELASGCEGSFVTGVTVVRTAFAEEHPEAVQRFLEEHAAAAAQANDDPASIAAKVVELGIVGSEQLAEKAIPACNIVCITGADMQTQLEGYLSALHAQDPSSVGGQLPDAGFYYLG